ncbi:MAG: hypothetical protein MRY32_08130 [Rickettsiales bacterium]|nr:hypothetical protein [Rickettsiales bacterium]
MVEGTYIPVTSSEATATMGDLLVDSPPCKSLGQKAAAFIAAGTTLVSANYLIDVYQPPLTAEYASLKMVEARNEHEEFFTFKHRDAILNYIDQHDHISPFLKSLQFMIREVFGGVDTILSIMNYDDENWSTLRVEIISDLEIDDLFDRENKLFELIEKDSSYSMAMEHLTISIN